LAFICIGVVAQNITSPQIRCVSVLSTGDISVTWQIPPNPSQFGSYQLLASTTKAGTYSLQASITNYNTNNYLCGVGNANTQPYFVYIYTVTSGSISLQPLDTVRTMFLSVSGTNPSSTPKLTWNIFADPLPPGEGSTFDIYRQRNSAAATWAKIATVPLNANGNINYFYLDSIRGICNLDSVRYRVQFTDSLLGCTSVSNVSQWHTVKDLNPPTIPLLDSVSVDAGGFAVMGISPAFSPDVACFVPYLYTSGSSYNGLDTLCTANTPTIYTYTASSANSGSEEFSVAGLDSCGNIGTIAFNPQKTIYTSASYDFCTKTAIIKWSPYINMVTGVNHYDVFYSVGGSAYTYLGDTTETTFFQHNLALSTTYCYYVRAHSNGKTVTGKDTATSTSNTFCITTSNPLEPTFVYLKNVTVNAQQTIDISWHVLKTDPIGGFNIYRSTSKTGAYSLIQNVSFSPATGDYSFTDNNVNTHTTEYFYYVDVLDKSCSNGAITSDTSNSILLNVTPGANLTASLSWNGYAKYTNGITGYNIYRSVNGSYGSPIATIAGNVNNYVDDVSQLADKEGMFLYYVEAVEQAPDSLGLQKSQSNFDTVYVDANLYIPNAFVPSQHSLNNVFLPIGAFIDNSDYILTIYNRWGQKIYETADPNKGWDGGGHEEGVYAYTVQYKTSIGEYRQRSGTVNLIR